jgi:peptidoglycan/LPS O-acetylase OafA/YrhL
MQFYHVAQLAAFAVAAGIAWKTPRAPLWVLLLALSYVISVLYVHLAPKGGYWPPSQFVGLFLDGMVLIFIRENMKEQWEWALVTILGFMVTADVVQLLGVLTGYPPPFSKNSYGIILEGLNYLAIGLIGGMGLMDWVRAHDDRRHTVADVRTDLLHWAGDYAHRKTENPKTLRKW